MDTPILDLPLEQHPAVALRPESFGALVYHYETRRLLFLKDITLVRVVGALGDADSARAALEACGVDTHRHEKFGSALDRLMRSGVIRRRVAA